MTANTYTARRANIAANLARLQEKNPDAGADCLAMLGQSKKGENSNVFFSEAINAKIDALSLDVGAIFSPTINPKVTKRFVQFVGAVTHEDYSEIDRTTACILLGLHLAGDFPLTSGALWEIATGGSVKQEGMGEERRGVSVRTIKRMMGSVGVSTVGTQLSRSVGKNGFLQLVGATFGEPGKTNRPVTLNRAHPLVTSFLTMIEKGTEGQISEMVKD